METYGLTMTALADLSDEERARAAAEAAEQVRDTLRIHRDRRLDT